jgi:hypothetical protein
MLHEAGYYISRIRQRDDGTLTDLSRQHVVLGANYLRQIVAELAALAGTLAFGFLLEVIRGKGRAFVECTHCEVTPETGQAMEKRLLAEHERLKGPETPERFTLREPIRKGEPRNSFFRIARELRARVRKLAPEGKGERPAPPREAVLRQRVMTFLREHPDLMSWYMELWNLAHDRLSPELRKKYEHLDRTSILNLRRELSSFDTGVIGRKRVDIADFDFEGKRAMVTDITKRGGDPWHNFKTRFYQAVLQELMPELDVSAMEISDKALGTPTFIGEAGTRTSVDWPGPEPEGTP